MKEALVLIWMIQNGSTPFLLLFSTQQPSLQFRMAPTAPYDAATCAQALTMLQLGHSIHEITAKTGYNRLTIKWIEKRAQDRGYMHTTNSKIIMAYVEDLLCSGRPVKVTEEVEKQVIDAIFKNSTIHQLFTATIATLVSSLVKDSISAHMVY